MSPQRKPLGHTDYLQMKLHPDLMAYLREQAESEYCSVPEYVRRLIVTDMRTSKQIEEKA